MVVRVVRVVRTSGGTSFSQTPAPAGRTPFMSVSIQSRRLFLHSPRRQYTSSMFDLRHSMSFVDIHWHCQILPCPQPQAVAVGMALPLAICHWPFAIGQWPLLPLPLALYLSCGVCRRCRG